MNRSRAPTGPPERDRGASGLGTRRVRWVAFGASALVHLVLILMYPGMRERGAQPVFSDGTPTASEAGGGIEVVRITEVAPAAELQPPDDPEILEEVDRPTPAPVVVPFEDGPGEGELVAPGPTAAERLRPRLEDARLWGPVDPALLELTLEQREELALAGRLEAWQDSVRAAAEAARRATDWTYTDGDGGRWGVSPGKLHLGSLTLPLPFAFGQAVGRRDEFRARAYELEEIRRQQATGEVRDSWKARSEAIRARRDRERARARADTSGTGR